MSNYTRLAGNNGVSGTGAPGTVTGSYGAGYNENGDLAVTGGNAVRRSVSKTGGAVSKVFSITSGLRLAYYGATLEVDIPALDANRSNA